MEIDFNIVDKELIISYSPLNGIEEINERLENEDEYRIKHTFLVTSKLIRDNVEEDYFEDTMSFCIGTIKGNFIEINRDVIGTDYRFYFSKNISLKQNMFIAAYNISILRKIDQVLDDDFYVVEENERHNGVPIEAYNNLIKHFPKSAELTHYTHSRISNLLKEWIPECDKYQVIYDKFIENKSKSLVNEKRIYLSKSNIEIELAQFSIARDALNEMLLNSKGIIEKVWQEKIHGILDLLYPQYIYSTREICFKGIDKNDKQPDFILVDTNGFIDILEIIKPDVQLITKQASYRNNYVPVREFSGAVQQMEKYIFCLSSIEKSQEQVINKLKAKLEEDNLSEIEPKIVSPKGILLLGRSNEFNTQQKRDFEIIKRQYKNIADIMTYDDLLNRINNIINSLKIKRNKLIDVEDMLKFLL